MGKNDDIDLVTHTLVIIFFHTKNISKMQASLSFFLVIILLVQIGNAGPKHKPIRELRYTEVFSGHRKEKNEAKTDVIRQNAWLGRRVCRRWCAIPGRCCSYSGHGQ